MISPLQSFELLRGGLAERIDVNVGGTGHDRSPKRISLKDDDHHQCPNVFSQQRMIFFNSVAGGNFPTS